MISRIIKLLSVLLIVALALYVVLNNKQEVVVYLSQTQTYSTTLGVAILVFFTTGLLLAIGVASLYGFRAYMKERALINRDKQRQLFLDQLLHARAATEGENWTKAQLLWEQLVKRDPTGIIARLELSKVLERSGDVREALRVVDEARIAHPQNQEVLYRAAELNLKLGNDTLALDNLSVINESALEKRAATVALNLYERSGRIEEAMNLYSKLESSGATQGEDGIRLRYRQLMLRKDETSSEWRNELATFTKKYPQFTPALLEIAEVEKKGGRTESAAQYLNRAAKTDQSLDLYQKVVELWLEKHSPDKALSAAKSARSELQGTQKVRAELLVIRLYLRLNMLDDAETALNHFLDLSRGVNAELDSSTLGEYFALRGILLSLRGRLRESAEVWKTLDESRLGGSSKLLLKSYTPPADAPSPELSTM